MPRITSVRTVRDNLTDMNAEIVDLVKPDEPVREVTPGLADYEVRLWATGFVTVHPENEDK